MINQASKTDISLRTDVIAAQLPRPQTGTPKADNNERLSSPSQEALQSALSDQPEIRPEVVARGEELVVDANYPPKEIIRQLSELLIGSTDLAEE